MCRNGRENICENHIGLGFMNQAPGAFAEEVHIPNADITQSRCPTASMPKPPPAVAVGS